MMFKRRIVRLAVRGAKKTVCAHPGKNTGAGQRHGGTKRSTQSQWQCCGFNL